MKLVVYYLERNMKFLAFQFCALSDMSKLLHFQCGQVLYVSISSTISVVVIQ
jgi:hypothetical protein